MQPSSLAALALALVATAPAAQTTAPNADPSPAASRAVPPPAARVADGPNATGAVSTGPALRPGKTLKAGAATKILVYDHNTHHGLAATAASNLSPGATTVADSTSFDFLLSSQTWDVVAIDVPSTIPTNGWTGVINYVNGGGRVVLSYWDWDAQSALASAFDVTVSGSLSWDGTTLFDAGVRPAFLGVTMPNSDWHGHWGDDGDTFTPHAGAQGLAHVGSISQPVIVRGNNGRTIAAPELDDSGDSWLADGSAVQLWENLIRMVLITDGPDVLVYDQSSDNHLAQLGAFEHYPGTTQIASSTTFDARLASQPWDVVLVDCPSTGPSAGWSALVNYVNAGGNVVMSFWDWDNSSGAGHPGLTSAFDVNLGADLSLFGATLFDSGQTDAFQGVSMPNSSWNDSWIDDGDRFTPIAPARGVAHVGSPSQPVMVWGNAARTIAAPVLDEAGPVWLGNGSGAQLWANLLEMVSGPDPECAFRNGILGLNPADYTCIVPPVLGGTWVASVSTSPDIGVTTLTTFVTLGLGGPAQGIPVFGYELLILPPFFETTALGTHNIPVSQDPLFAGMTIPSQGARIELGSGGALHVVLTNGQDVTFGVQ